jgi:hypothetical protein
VSLDKLEVPLLDPEVLFQDAGYFGFVVVDLERHRMPDRDPELRFLDLVG